VTADRAVPGYTAVAWDDEGVAPAAATLIDAGTLRGYHTTRETAALLRAGASGGFASAPRASQAVMAGGAHLALVPGMQRASLEDLLRGVTHGLLVLGGEPEVEPGLSSGVFNGHMVLEVKHGKPVAHVRNVKPRFITQRLWRGQLRVLGDASTEATAVVRTRKGMPWQEMTQVATAPAVLIADVDVVSADV
jgi:predicted Zn-dependent protease